MAQEQRMTPMPGSPPSEGVSATVPEGSPVEEAARSTRSILFVRAISLAVVFVGSVALARSLGPEERGAHGFVTATSIILAAVFGLAAHTGGYILATRHGAVRARLVENAAWFGLATGAAGTLALLGAEAILSPLPPALTAVPAWPLLTFVAIAGFTTNSHEVQLAFAGRRSMAGAVFSFAPYTLAAVCYVVLLVVAPGDLAVALWTFALAPVAVSVLVAIRTPEARLPVGRPDRLLATGAVRQGLRSYPGELAAMLHQRLDVVLLGLLAPINALGIYVVAYQAVEPILVLSAASAASILALGHGRPDVEGGAVTVRLVRQTLVLGGIGGILAILLAPILVPLVYGPEFAASVGPLRILVPGLLGLAIGRIAMADLMRRNLLGTMAFVSIAAMLVNTAINLVLIPRLGETGAAVASLISYTAYAAAALTVLHAASGFEWRTLRPRRSDVLDVLHVGRLRRTPQA
jgi:O-antigen/teichoic acid export membrane protein